MHFFYAQGRFRFDFLRLDKVPDLGPIQETFDRLNHVEILLDNDDSKLTFHDPKIDHISSFFKSIFRKVANTNNVQMTCSITFREGENSSLDYPDFHREIGKLYASNKVALKSEYYCLRNGFLTFREATLENGQYYGRKKCITLLRP